jgi:hypothetical protein
VKYLKKTQHHRPNKRKRTPQRIKKTAIKEVKQEVERGGKGNAQSRIRRKPTTNRYETLYLYHS